MMRTIRLARIILAAVAAILMGHEAVTAEPSETLARSGTAPVELGAAPVAVQLVTPAPGETLSARAAAAGRRIYLVFKGLATDEPPDTVYQIYFGLPPGTAPAPDGQYYVGSLNFFNAAKRGSAVSDPRFFSFDVTSRLRALHADQRAIVTLVPASSPRSGARAAVGEIAIVEQ
jgi:hypothetical protein